MCVCVCVSGRPSIFSFFSLSLSLSSDSSQFQAAAKSNKHLLIPKQTNSVVFNRLIDHLIRSLFSKRLVFFCSSSQTRSCLLSHSWKITRKRISFFFPSVLCVCVVQNISSCLLFLLLFALLWFISSYFFRALFSP